MASCPPTSDHDVQRYVASKTGTVFQCGALWWALVLHRWLRRPIGIARALEPLVWIAQGGRAHDVSVVAVTEYHVQRKILPSFERLFSVPVECLIKGFLRDFVPAS